jgi:hypothetical protein
VWIARLRCPGSRGERERRTTPPCLYSSKVHKGHMPSSILAGWIGLLGLTLALVQEGGRERERINNNSGCQSAASVPTEILFPISTYRSLSRWYHCRPVPRPMDLPPPFSSTFDAFLPPSSRVSRSSVIKLFQVFVWLLPSGLPIERPCYYCSAVVAVHRVVGTSCLSLRAPLDRFFPQTNRTGQLL